jgi:hypothetical protein
MLRLSGAQFRHAASIKKAEAVPKFIAGRQQTVPTMLTAF